MPLHFKLRNITETFIVNLRLILQLQRAEPLYFPVIWQCYLTLLSPTSNRLSYVQHLLLNWNICSSSSDITKFLLKCFFITFCNNHTLRELFQWMYKPHFFLCKKHLACWIYHQHKQLYKQNYQKYVLDIFQYLKYYYFYHYP